MVITSQISTTALKMSISEDPMELSSEIDRGLLADEDTDIDIDLTGEQPQDRDDDYMAEDSHSMTSQTPFVENEAQDGGDSDMSYDRLSPQDVEVLSSLQDEDLNDAEYNVLDDKVDEAQESSLAGGYNEISKLSDNTFQSLDQDNLTATNHTQHNSPLGSPDLDRYEVQSSEPLIETSVVSNNKVDNIQHLGTTDSPYKPVRIEHDQDPLRVEEIVERSEFVSNAATADEDVAEPTFSSPVSEKVSSEHDSESQQEYSLENSASLHPIMIVYQETEMFLFPPITQDQDNSQTYFLEDETFATENIKDLLGACRLVLAESIEEDEELQITFDDLGLSICESTTDSSIVTLSQICDLYVQLQQNDGVETPEPLYLTLSTMTKFSHRFDYILQTAAEGKGFSQLLPTERVKGQSQDHERFQQNQPEEMLSNVPMNSAFQEPCEPSRSDGTVEEAVERQNSQIAIVPSENFDLNSQRREEPSNTNSFQEVSGTTEDLAVDFKQPGTNPKFSQPLEQTSTAIQIPSSASDSAAAPISAIQHRSKQLNLEDEDSISYDENEDDPIQGSSTRSSTIQGDIIEAVVNASDSSLKPPALLASVQRPSSSYDVVNVDPKSSLNSQPSLLVSPHTAGLEDRSITDSDLLMDVSQESSKDREIQAAKSLDEYEGSQVIQKPTASQSSNSHTVVADTNDYSTPLRKESFVSTYTEKSQNEPFDTEPQNSSLPKLDKLNTDDHVSKIRVAKDINGQKVSTYPESQKRNTRDISGKAQLSESNQSFAKESHKNIDHSTSELIAEIQPFLKPSVGVFADADEITYDDDDDDDELLEDSISKNVRSSPASLKRLRENHENNLLNGDDLHDAKRSRSG